MSKIIEFSLRNENLKYSHHKEVASVKTVVENEEQDEIGIFRIEIEEKKGAWLDEFFPHGNEGGEKDRTKGLRLKRSNLTDIGVSANESANARLIAKEKSSLKRSNLKDIGVHKKESANARLFVGRGSKNASKNKPLSNKGLNDTLTDIGVCRYKKSPEQINVRA